MSGFKSIGTVNLTSKAKNIAEGLEDEKKHQLINKHVMEINYLVLKNRRLAIRNPADTIGISKGLVKIVLKYILSLKRIKSRLVFASQ